MSTTVLSVMSISVCVACVLACCVTANAADPLPPQRIPDVCGVQLKNHNFTAEDMKQLHDMGFRIIRKGIYWNAVEKEKGVYDFSAFDEQMNEAKRLNLKVVGCLFGGNKLYEDDGRGGIQTEAGREGFANFAAAAVKHYQDHDVLWEVWNEPNVRTFWRKDGKHNSDEFADEYTSLVKAVMAAVLKADKGAFVMAGSVSNYWEPSYEWTESCFKKGILKSGIRGWSVHPYGVKTPEEFAVGHTRTRQLLKQYGAPDMPMLNTERGFAVKETHEGWSGGSQERAREFQAWHFVRQYMIDQLHDIRLTVWYEWDGEKFGLADDDGSRPVYTAAKVMFDQLDGYRLVRRLDADRKLDYVLLFENEAGKRKLVAWTAPPPGGTPEEALPHVVSIGVGKQPVFKVVDHEGKAQAVADGVALTLSGAPQYVDVPADVELGKVAAFEAAVVAAPAGSDDIAPPAGAVDLKLFEEGDVWTFVENTGAGSFTVTEDDGKRVGVMSYDFTKSKARSTPYVLAHTDVSIAEGATAVMIHARSAIAQQLTFRLIDSTGQTHQFKTRVSGGDGWEAVRIPLTRRLEHWGGAKDGKVHFPVKQLVFSVPQPGNNVKIGKVKYGKALAVREGP